MADVTISQLQSVSKVTSLSSSVIPVSNGITTSKVNLNALMPEKVGPLAAYYSEKIVYGYKASANTNTDLFSIAVNNGTFSGGSINVDLAFFHAGGGRHGVYTRKKAILNAYADGNRDYPTQIFAEDYNSAFDENLTVPSTSKIVLTKPIINLIKLTWYPGNVTFTLDYFLHAKITVFGANLNNIDSPLVINNLGLDQMVTS